MTAAEQEELSLLRLLLDFALNLARVMHERKVSPAELTRRVRKPKDYVTRVLHGQEQDVELMDLVKLANALGCVIRVHLEPVEFRRHKPVKL